MVDIYQEDLDFLEEAKQAFQEVPRLETWRNKEGTHIALRCGMDRDCIYIYKLGPEVLFANNIMPKAPRLILSKTND